jgi:hypothetical protein
MFIVTHIASKLDFMQDYVHEINLFNSPNDVTN